METYADNEEFVEEVEFEHMQLIEEVNQAEFALDNAKKELHEFEVRNKHLLNN